jgi:hypothetical protein
VPTQAQNVVHDVGGASEMDALVRHLHDRYGRLRGDAIDATPDELVEHEITDDEQAHPAESLDETTAAAPIRPDKHCFLRALFSSSSRPRPRAYRLTYGCHGLVRQLRIERQRQHLTRGKFSDSEIAGAIPEEGKGRLQMHGRRIMHSRGDALFVQVAVQSVALAAAHDKQVVNVLPAGCGLGQRDARHIGQCPAVLVSECLASRVPRFQMAELHAQQRCLHTVHPTVEADYGMQILARLPVVAQQGDARRQCGIIGGHRAGVTEGAEVLAGVETEAAGTPEPTGSAASEAGAVCLGGILNDGGPEFVRQGGNLGHSCRLAVQMHGDDGAYPAILPLQYRPQASGIKSESAWVDVD